MKRVICDQCKTEVEPDHYGLAPRGWLSVSQRGSIEPSQDFCSPICAVKKLQGLPGDVPSDATTAVAVQ